MLRISRLAAVAAALVLLANAAGGAAAAGSAAVVKAPPLKWWKPARLTNGTFTRFQYQLSDSGSISIVPDVQVRGRWPGAGVAHRMHADPAAGGATVARPACTLPPWSAWQPCHPHQHHSPAVLAWLCAGSHAHCCLAAMQVYAIDFDTARDAIPVLRKKVPGVRQALM